MTTRTLSLDESAHGRSDRGSHLYVALAGGKPGGGARWSLAGIDRVEVGRGAMREARRTGTTLRVDLGDPWMSSSHVRFERELGHWIALDAGSRNGILVDGAKVTRAIVHDRAVIEVGRSYLMLRDGEPLAEPALELPSTYPPGALVTLDPALAIVFAELAQIAASTLPVLVGGPTGSGKERIARAIHDRSRRAGAYVPVNCGALPAGLVESELFGHKRGAFSGAIANSPGLVVAASGGTLFLDEIGDLPPPAQAALLRVLEAGEVRAIGATSATAIDLRVAAATHRDLGAMVSAGTFREDLLARLAGFEIELPGLADRRVDLGTILAEIAPDVTFAAAAARALFAYAWPRNIRELARAIERAQALGGGGEIGLAQLPAEVVDAKFGAPPLAHDARHDQLVELLVKHRGNVTKIAEELGHVRQQVQRWLKRYQLDPERYR